MKRLLTALIHAIASVFFGAACANHASRADVSSSVAMGICSGVMLTVAVAFVGIYIGERLADRSKRVADGCYGSGER